MNRLISIIIPTYNRAHLIGETLDSILVQSYTNWECIIVDDGSTDSTDQVLQTYLKDNRFQYHKRPVDIVKGVNTCRNYGYGLSKGEWIKWFDSDDLMLPDLLQKQFSSLNDAEVCVCKIVKYNFEDSTTLSANKIQSVNLISDYLTGKIAFYVSGPLWERTFLEKQVHLFDENISNLDDWDFNLRMLYQKPTIVFIDEPLIQYRIHPDSLSHEIEKLNKVEIQSEFLAREKHLKLLENNKDINSSILRSYIITRYSFLLREALVQKNTVKYYLLQKLLKKQFEVLNIIGICKILFGFSVYSVFNVGYKIIK